MIVREEIEMDDTQEILEEQDNEDDITNLLLWSKKVSADRSLLFLYLNINSIRHKFDEFCAEMNDSFGDDRTFV